VLSAFVSRLFEKRPSLKIVIPLAALVSTTLTLTYCRIIGWRSFSESGDPSSVFASFFFQDFAVVSVLCLLVATQKKWFGGWAGVLLIVALCSFVSMAGLANIFALHIVGSPLDVAWLSEINPRDTGTAIPMIVAYISPSMQRLALICLVGFPITSLVAGMWLADRLFLLNLALALCLTLTGASYFLVANASFSAEKYLVMRNPVFHDAGKILFPSKVDDYLAGNDNGGYQKTSKAFHEQPEQASTFGCCKDFNILLITLDTVPLKTLRSALEEQNASRYPTLKKLMSYGADFENFYTNFPMSAQSMGAMMTSIYPSFSPLFSTMEEVHDRKIETLISVLRANDYQTGMFMSGQLKYAGARELLVSQSIDTMVDSDTMKCGPADSTVLSLYAHLGDDCLANEVEQWLDKKRDDKFLAWVWFTNPHSPYYTKDRALIGGQLGSREQHLDALSETDAAIGALIEKVENLSLANKTLILLVGDHGEAFGEHGYLNHGTSIYEEQVRVPMIVYAPGIKNLPVDPDRIGAMVDLAPTILDMVAISTPKGWQGHSLFSKFHPNRAYFASKRSGKMVGYREKTHKYILSSNHDKLLYFDLSKDPDELDPLELDDRREEDVMNEIAAFVSYRKGMSWPQKLK
jgi:Sulfatase